jgi:hypothetical protein
LRVYKTIFLPGVDDRLNFFFQTGVILYRQDFP